jgi:hypothetical protein
MAVFNDPEATTPLFGRICGASTLLPPYGQSSVVEQDRKRLVRYPLRYESSNLNFLQALFGSPRLRLTLYAASTSSCISTRTSAAVPTNGLRRFFVAVVLFVCGRSGPSEVQATQSASGTLKAVGQLDWIDLRRGKIVPSGSSDPASSTVVLYPPKINCGVSGNATTCKPTEYL